MSANRKFIDYVADLLAPLGPLSDSKFFGGHAFKCNGIQFAMIMGNTLYFCVGESNRKKYIAVDSKPFSYSTKNGRVEVKKYFSVPEEMLEGPSQLLEWAREAIASAKNAK